MRRKGARAQAPGGVRRPFLVFRPCGALRAHDLKIEPVAGYRRQSDLYRPVVCLAERQSFGDAKILHAPRSDVDPGRRCSRQSQLDEDRHRRKDGAAHSVIVEIGECLRPQRRFKDNLPAERGRPHAARQQRVGYGLIDTSGPARRLVALDPISLSLERIRGQDDFAVRLSAVKRRPIYRDARGIDPRSNLQKLRPVARP